MTDDLKRTYFILLFPAAAGFLVVHILRHFHIVEWNIPQFPGMISSIFFVVSVCFAVALPIFFRAVFANKMRGQTHTPEADWLIFERNLLLIAMTTPYVCLIAMILQISRFFLAGTIIMALYAVYYYYPSKKRIAFDRRIFRVK